MTVKLVGLSKIDRSRFLPVKLKCQVVRIFKIVKEILNVSNY
jgi:hypothetical protein